MNCWMDTDTHTHSLIHFHPLCRKIAFCSLTNGLIGVWFQSSQPLRPLDYPLKSTPFSLPSSLHFLSPHILLLHLSVYSTLPLFTISPLICASVYIYSRVLCKWRTHTQLPECVWDSVCVFSQRGQGDHYLFTSNHMCTSTPSDQHQTFPNTCVLLSRWAGGIYFLYLTHSISQTGVNVYLYTCTFQSAGSSTKSHTINTHDKQLESGNEMNTPQRCVKPPV